METEIYGYFSNYLWRDEKTGKCLFRFTTDFQFLLEKQYMSQEVMRNRQGKDVVWSTIKVYPEKPTPVYKRKMPLKIKGRFDRSSNEEHWRFVASEVTEDCISEQIMKNYLATFKGIDREMAQAAVDEFGPKFFTKIYENGFLKDLSKAAKIPAKVAKDMAEEIKKIQTEHKLCEKLLPEIPYPSCAKAIAVYGASADEVLTRHPYSVGETLGMGFWQRDKVAFLCGYTSRNPERVQSAAYEARRNLTNAGNTWYTQGKILHEARRVLKTNIYTDNSFDVFWGIQRVSGTMRLDGKEVFYDRDLIAAEASAAKNLIRLSRNAAKYEGEVPLLEAQEKCGARLGGGQAIAVKDILQDRRPKVLAGGPGTGKTTTVKTIVACYEMMHPTHKIALCAPTGRASQRLSESAGREALTVHRLLDYRPYGGNKAAHKDASNPIDADFIVVDEMSMMDVELFSIFLSAVKTGTLLLFVGDSDQLEAVGPGTVFKDLFLMPDEVTGKCRLTEVFRQAGDSPIVQNAAKINLGRTDFEKHQAFQVIRVKSELEAKQEAVGIMRRLYNKDDPFETQVLCAVKKGEAGVYALNKQLQEILNSNASGLIYGSTKFRIGDKILMSQNNYDEKCLYYNGDVGVVKSTDKIGLTLDVRGEDLVIPKEHLDDVRLAYAMTIHKSQGSEFKNVIIILTKKHRNMLARNLLYTAVTRAKDSVYIITEDDAMEIAAETNNAAQRHTTLLRQVHQESGG